MADRVRLRRDTAANWIAVNPIPADGQQCLETDTGFIKIGNGVTAWNSLEYSVFGRASTTSKIGLMSSSDKTKLDGIVLSQTPAADKVPQANDDGIIDSGWLDALVARELRLLAIGINPTLDLDFSRQQYRAYDGAKGLVEIADPWSSGFFTFSRASTKTYFDALGTMVTASSGSPVIEYDQATGECLGYSVHPSAKNLFLNSNSPVTQSVPTTAQVYTLSFVGTGTITLSGSATGTLVGAGSTTRASLTVTATAGSVTITLSGSVSLVQFELGYYVTPYIETGASAITRAADALSITGANFSKWFRGGSGTFVVKYHAKNEVFGTPTGKYLLCASDGASLNQIALWRRASVDTTTRLTITKDSVSQAFPTPGVFLTSGILACSYTTNNASICQNGVAPVVDSDCQIPVCTQLNIGSSQLNNTYFNGHVSRILYFPSALTAAQIQELTK